MMTYAELKQACDLAGLQDTDAVWFIDLHPTTEHTIIELTKHDTLGYAVTNQPVLLPLHAAHDQGTLHPSPEAVMQARFDRVAARVAFPDDTPAAGASPQPDSPSRTSSSGVSPSSAAATSTPAKSATSSTSTAGPSSASSDKDKASKI